MIQKILLCISQLIKLLFKFKIGLEVSNECYYLHLQTNLKDLLRVLLAVTYID